MTLLSKRSRKLLRWICNHDQWATKAEIQKRCKIFEERAFTAIIEAKFVNMRRGGERGQWVQYQINESGKAYLEGAKLARQSDIREWLSFGLSIAAIIISIIALLIQAGIL